MYSTTTASYNVVVSIDSLCNHVYAFQSHIDLLHKTSMGMQWVCTRSMILCEGDTELFLRMHKNPLPKQCEEQNKLTLGCKSMFEREWRGGQGEFQTELHSACAWTSDGCQNVNVTSTSPSLVVTAYTSVFHNNCLLQCRCVHKDLICSDVYVFLSHIDLLQTSMGMQ